MGLGTLLGKIELERTRSIIPLNDFLNASTSIYYAGSFAYRAASYVVAKPLWWALEQLSLVESEDHFEPEFRLWRKAKGPYVVMSNVEQAADAAVNLLRKKANLSPADSLYSFDSFRKDFGRHSALIDGVALSELDIKVLIKFLDRDRGVLVTNNEVDDGNDCVRAVIYLDFLFRLSNLMKVLLMRTE